MQRSVRRRAALLVGDVDPWLVLAFVGLMIAGVVMVYSASIGDAYLYYGSQYYVIERELMFMVVGLVGLLAAARTSYRFWGRIAGPFFLISMALLGLVMLPHVGHSSHGAQRWFSLGAGLSLEPSELVKFALIVYLATWFPKKGDAVRDFQKTFVPFSMIVGLIFLMIVKQPDLGTALVVGVTATCVYFIAGADPKHLAIVGAGSGLVAWMLMHGTGYRQNRLTAFLNPWHDPTGVGYHTVQALLALGSGGVVGRGLGNSQAKFIIPAPHTDSILAVIGEELGLAGTAGILLLFLVVAYRGMRISATAPDAFGKLLAAGITSWITFQALMNFAVITSSVPFTGVPLPFISYGGTSLIITMIAMGILFNISRHTSGEGFVRESPGDGRRDGGPRLPRVIDHASLDGRRQPAARPVRSGEAIPPRRIRRPAVR